ncbi:MFS transporter [Devosia sp. CN2-171]|uniref:MFS transporter n=1 Tax=Devosia sp. CN2-171 TaxID=3400909 RepID=UPI003BF78442
MGNRYGWVIVAAGAVITCIAMGTMFALPVYLQPIAEETGWTRAGISGAMTVGFIVMGIAGFGWGTLSDRIGARPVVLIAVVLLGAGLVLASQARDLLVFQFAYGGLVGASGGAFFAPIISTTLGWFDKNRSLAVSLVSVGGGIAPMTLSPLAGYLIEQIGWRASMFWIALGAIVVLLPVAMLIRSAPAVAEAPPPAASGQAAPAKHSSGFAVLRTPQFIVLAVTFFLCCGAHSGPIFHTVSYAMICGASLTAATGIYAIEGVAGLFGRVLFGTLADRIGVRKVIVAGLALQAVGIYAYIYMSEISQFYLLASVLGLVYGGVMPLYSVLAREYFPPRLLGTVLGAATMTSSIGMAFGPLGGGWLYDTFGSYHWLYIASAVVGLAAAAMALAFPPAKRGEDQQPTALQPA